MVSLYDWDTWKSGLKETLLALPFVILLAIIMWFVPQSARDIIVIVLLAFVLAIIIIGIARDFRKHYKARFKDSGIAKTRESRVNIHFWLGCVSVEGECRKSL
jgi:c-di-AMP phosphodiesterase-like protein